jgi:hypothetical protein
LLSRVKRISSIKVEAGYDIISFNSMTSNEVDRFIEVKSFSKKPEFYWSRNEIGTAEMKGSKYFLYLVDRSLIGKNDYEPQIIQDPYKNIFGDPNWQKDPQNWLVRPSFEQSFIKKRT